ncbi:MAG: hypothetical protein OEZ39_16000 [Gammaproteobacteria bacterium]|nr:hypothetical protein [Gammaproteobacteria bacterium]MDH5653361.1 hypothetical protein [Gammaproteobacteria bacterium]
MSANEKTKKILELCEKHWEKNKLNCSGYVKDIATDLGISLSGQANDIIDQIQKAPWKTLKTGVDARLQATNGMFVIAGLKDQPNGHVAVIVPGALAHGKYPTGYWGSLAGRPKKNTTINWSWSKTDRDKVIYSYIAIK